MPSFATARVKAFDWLRGLAVLVMIECHAMVLLRHELLATPTARALDWLNGLVAPSFIFAAGFSLALTQVRTAASAADRTARRARLVRTLRRIAEVLAVGMLVNWVWFPISVDPGWLLRVDILPCIAVSLLLALPLFAGLATRPRVLERAALAVALGIFFVAPFAEHWGGPLVDWLHKSGPRNSVFPLFPWAGWVFLGGAVGARAALEPIERVRLQLVGLAVGALAVALLQPVWLRSYPQHAFWVTDPANSARRCLVVALALVGLSRLESRRSRATRGAPRTSAPVRFVELFGTSSLAAYFFHEMLLYYEVRGVSLAKVAGGRNGWGGYVALALAVVAATAMLAALTDGLYRRLDPPRVTPRPTAHAAPDLAA